MKSSAKAEFVITPGIALAGYTEISGLILNVKSERLLQSTVEEELTTLRSGVNDCVALTLENETCEDR